MAKTVTVTFVAPRHVGLTHDDFGIGSTKWPETVTYQGKQYFITTYENPLVDASLFAIFYVASDGERIAVDYEGSEWSGLDGTSQYEPHAVQLKQVIASEVGLKLSEHQLDWQDTEVEVDGVPYAMRAYEWTPGGELYAVFASIARAAHDDEIADLEILA